MPRTAVYCLRNIFLSPIIIMTLIFVVSHQFVSDLLLLNTEKVHLTPT